MIFVFLCVIVLIVASYLLFDINSLSHIWHLLSFLVVIFALYLVFYSDKIIAIWPGRVLADVWYLGRSFWVSTATFPGICSPPKCRFYFFRASIRLSDVVESRRYRLSCLLPLFTPPLFSRFIHVRAILLAAGRSLLVIWYFGRDFLLSADPPSIFRRPDFP